MISALGFDLVTADLWSSAALMLCKCAHILLQSLTIGLGTIDTCERPQASPRHMAKVGGLPSSATGLSDAYGDAAYLACATSVKSTEPCSATRMPAARRFAFALDASAAPATTQRHTNRIRNFNSRRCSRTPGCPIRSIRIYPRCNVPQAQPAIHAWQR